MSLYILLEVTLYSVQFEHIQCFVCLFSSFLHGLGMLKIIVRKANLVYILCV